MEQIMLTMRKRSSDILREARSFRAPSSVTDEAIFNFFSAIDTPKSLAAWILYKTRSHDQLTEIDCHPEHYEFAHAFRLDLAAVSFLSKCDFLKTSFKRDEQAFAKFRQYEELCRVTNRRFSNPQLDPQNNGSNVWLLNAVKRKIEQVLGDFSPDEFVDQANWGPGVSTMIKGEHVSAINKFHDERGITRDLYSLVGDWFHVAYPLWSTSSRDSLRKQWCFEGGNSVVTVPKNSKTDRVIAIEPGVNLWFQKACGSMIRRRLRRFGIDLNSQERNQELARKGSLIPLGQAGALATVDFSSASDSIAKSVVEELLPRRWFLLLDACRSKIGTLGQDVIHWQKFSSMGNGFTFELESLIFYAAAYAVTEYLGLDCSEISVFGDDVILPASAFDLFTSFSAFLGFKVNPSKSFHDGPFRESCGAFYYSGTDCKPLFFKKRVTDVESLYKLANGIRLLAHRHNRNSGCDARFSDCWSALFLRIPEPLRLRVPREAGDSGLVSNFDEATPRRARYGIEGYYYRQLARVGVMASSESSAVLCARLWQGSSERAYMNSYALRGRSQRLLVETLVVRWYDLGPWE